MYHKEQEQAEQKRTEDIVKQVVSSINGNGAPTGGVLGIQAAILSTTEQRNHANQILTLQKQLKESENANQPTAASILAKDQAMEELKDALKASRAIAAAATAAATAATAAANAAIAKLNAVNAATPASTLGLVTNAVPNIADLLRLLQQQNTKGSTSSNSHNNSNGNSNNSTNSSNNSNNGNNSNDSHNNSNNGNNSNDNFNNSSSSNSSNSSNNSNNNNSGKRNAGSSLRHPGSKKPKRVALTGFDIDFDAAFRDQDELEHEQDEIEQGETGYTNTLDGNELNTELKKHKADRAKKRALATTVRDLTANIRQRNKSTVNQKKNLQILLNTYEIPTPDPWNVTIAREWLALHYITHGMPIDK